jgi:hypothetical protein
VNPPRFVRYAAAAVRPRSRARRIALVLVALVGVVLGVGAWLLRVEDIPDELPPLAGSPDDVVIPALDGASELRLSALRGKTAFFVVVGPHTGDSKEGQKLNRALNRWRFPEGTIGYIVGDAEGFGLFRGKIEKLMRFFGAEMRYPVFVDFEGVFVRTFALPKGHHGFVVLGPQGELLERRSGGIDDAAELERVRALLGGSEPEPGPLAPTFVAGDVDPAGCREAACALVFLGREVARSEVPGIADGFDGDEDAAFEKMRDPAVRMVSTLLRMQLTDARGVVVGRTRDLELTTWRRLEDAPELRAAFELQEGDTAIVVIDTDGRVAFRKVGFVPLYEWGRVADLLGVEINDRKPAKGD